MIMYGYVILPEGSFTNATVALWGPMIHVALFHVTVMGLQSNSIQQRLQSILDAIVKQSHKKPLAMKQV